MIKAVFFDIDGTLYNSDINYINESSLQAIRQLHDQGILVGVCTGRSRKEIRSIPREILTLPFDVFITSGGTCSYFKDGRRLHHTYFTKEQVEKVMSFKEAGDFDLDIGFLDDTDSGILWECGEMGKINFDWYRLPIPAIREPDYTTVCHFMLAVSEKYHSLADPYLEGLSYFSSSPYSIDIYPPNVHKAYGIKKAIKAFGITMDEVMAFGDDVNDIEMLEEVGLGIAMGNGSEFAKKSAKFVTKTMQEDGILYALKKYEVLV